MKIIGVTGGIGSGKSTVCNIAARMYSVNIINADELSREAVEIPSVKQELSEAFGSKIFTNGKLDRKKLAQIVFTDDSKREHLNNIIHPQVRAMFNDAVNNYRQAGCSYVLYECPLLIEANLIGDVDFVVLVYSDKENRIKNIIARDNTTLAHAEKRINAQMELDDKIKYADMVIYNNSGIDDLRNAVRIAFDALLKSNA